MSGIRVSTDCESDPESNDPLEGFKFGITEKEGFFSDGISECLKLDAGNAASIHSDDENVAIFELMDRDGRDKAIGVWIGLFDEIQAGVADDFRPERFSWLDGTDLDFGTVSRELPWSAFNPNNNRGGENCVRIAAIPNDGQDEVWDDVICDTVRPMVCKFKCIVPTSEPTSSPSTSEPTLEPTFSPSTSEPTFSPSTSEPTFQPSITPSAAPIESPTFDLTPVPTSSPVPLDAGSNGKAAVISVGGISAILCLIILFLVMRKRSRRNTERKEIMTIRINAEKKTFEDLSDDKIPVAERVSDSLELESKRSRMFPTQVFSRASMFWATRQKSIAAPFGAQLPKPLRAKHPLPAHHLSVNTTSTTDNQMHRGRNTDSGRNDRTNSPRYKLLEAESHYDASTVDQSTKSRGPRYEFDF